LLGARVAASLAAFILLTQLLPAAATGVTPAYAQVGASATYSEFGGFVAFFGGVYGNVSFTVTSVFPNGTMGVRVQANVSQSGEAPPETLDRNFTDSVESPSQFPAVPPENLTRPSFTFEDTALTYVSDQVISVPGGSFKTTSFSGRSSDGNFSYFWFDRGTGLVVQVEKGGAVLQLQSSNIAAPVPAQPNEWSLLSLILPVAALWAAAGAFFFFVIRRAQKGAKGSETGTEL